MSYIEIDPPPFWPPPFKGILPGLDHLVIGPGLLPHDPFDPHKQVVDKADPPHYKDLAVQPLEACEAWGLCLHLGQVVKYVSRCGKKKGESVLDDLRKALFYLQRKIALVEAEAGGPPPPPLGAKP